MAEPFVLRDPDDELRLVVSMLGEPGRRDRLLARLDDLVGSARRTTLDELEERQRADAARTAVEHLAMLAAAAEADLAMITSEVGALRRELADERARTAQLRDLLTPGLADRLIELAARIEHERPNDHPPLCVRRAAELARAVESTRPAW